MEELTALLNQIEDTYYDFVSGVLNYAEKKAERKEKLLDYLKSNDNLKSSDVVKFVSDQPDFMEDVAFYKEQVG